MITPAEKSSRGGSHAPASGLSELRADAASELLSDDRPQSLQVMKLQSAADASPTVRQLMAHRQTIQRVVSNRVLNVAGERHDEWAKLRGREQKFAADKAGGQLWLEHEFVGRDDSGSKVHGDGLLVRLRYLFGIRFSNVEGFGPLIEKATVPETLDRIVRSIASSTERRREQPRLTYGQATPAERKMADEKGELFSLWDEFVFEVQYAETAVEVEKDLESKRKRLQALFLLAKTTRANVEAVMGPIMDKQERNLRSEDMHQVAQNEGLNQRGIWKIGDDHVRDILADQDASSLTYNLIGKDSYRAQFDEWNRRESEPSRKAEQEA